MTEVVSAWRVKMMHHPSLLPLLLLPARMPSSALIQLGNLVTRERGIMIARPFGLNKLPCHRGESTELSILLAFIGPGSSNKHSKPFKRYKLGR